MGAQRYSNNDNKRGDNNDNHGDPDGKNEDSINGHYRIITTTVITIINHSISVSNNNRFETDCIADYKLERKLLWKEW